MGVPLCKLSQAHRAWLFASRRIDEMDVMCCSTTSTWWVCIVRMSTTADILSGHSKGSSICRYPNLDFVESSILSALRTITSADPFSIGGTHQYRFRFRYAFRIVLNETRRPLTYLYRPNFPLRV
jgi:hypothetical protein